MTVLILGQAGSGKSALAEDIAVESGGSRRYYIATMKVYDKEGIARVEKHRRQREGKGFITIERQYDLAGVTDMMKDPGHAVVLLECVSNLVGNELFENPDMTDEKRKLLIPAKGDARTVFAERIFADIKLLSERVACLIVVSNTYEADGASYDDETRLYVRMLELVNERLIRFSDRVIDLRHM